MLNSIGTKDRVAHPLFPKNRVRGLDDFRVKLVSDLAIQHGAKIVISSTWREYWSLPDLRTLLQKYGMDPKVEIIDQTPKSYEHVGWGFGPKRGERGDDIALWLEQNGNPKCYLILDDIECHHDGRQVLTTDGTGFFKGLMQRANKILSRVDDP